jgi:succinate-acetate transporter protein
MSENKKFTEIADPGPLGLAAFATTTFVLSMINAQLVPSTVADAFLTLALFFGGGAQLLAGMWEFKKNNTFGATAFTSYGAFWLALAGIVYGEKLGLINFGADANIGVGIFLVGWTVFTFYMCIGSIATNKALLYVFTTLLLTFILLDFEKFGILANGIPAGMMGLACAAGAWYASAAGIINSTFGKIILPIGAKKQLTGKVVLPIGAKNQAAH